jgi:hypothetical protein
LLTSWGATFENGPDTVFAPVIGGRLTGGPAWPTREGFRVLRSQRTTIVTSEGLSDPYAPGEAVRGLERWSGTGLEVWLETDQPIANPVDSWPFRVVKVVATNVAAHAVRRDLIDELGVLVLEIYADDVGIAAGEQPELVTHDGTIGCLLGLRTPSRPSTLKIAPSDVRFLNARLLLLDQTMRLRQGGEAARKTLAQKLEQTPNGWISRMPARVSLPPDDDRPWWKKLIGG